MSHDAIALSAEVMQNVEQANTPLSSLVLKAKRLAQLVGESDYETIMQYEEEGYPTPREGIPPEVRAMASIAGRAYDRPDPLTGQPKQYLYVQSIGELEKAIQDAEADLAAATAGSAGYSPNPYRSVYIRQTIDHISGRLMGRRAFLYRYALQHHYRLRALLVREEDVAPLCENVDEALKKTMPRPVTSVAELYQKAGDDDTDTRAQAILKCRGILHELVDLESTLPGKGVPEDSSSKILQHMGGVSRILTFLHGSGEGQATSGKQAASREETRRYVISTALLVGDLLALWEWPPVTKQTKR